MHGGTGPRIAVASAVPWFAFRREGDLATNLGVVRCSNTAEEVSADAAIDKDEELNAGATPLSLENMVGCVPCPRSCRVFTS